MSSILLSYFLVQTRDDSQHLRFKLRKPLKTEKSRYNGSNPPNYVAEIILIEGDKPIYTTALDPAIHSGDQEFPSRSLVFPIPMRFRDFFQRYQQSTYHELPENRNGPGPSANDFYNNAIPQAVWNPAQQVYQRMYDYQGYRTGAMPDRRATNGWYSDYGVDSRGYQDIRHDYVWDDRTAQWENRPVGGRNWGTAHDYYGVDYDRYANDYYDNGWNQGNVFVPADANYGARGGLRGFASKAAQWFNPNAMRAGGRNGY